MIALLAFPALPALPQRLPQPPPRDQRLAIHLDPAATHIRFTLRGFPRSIHGTFQLKGGAVAANSASGLAQGEVLVDATTGRTGNAALDERMQKDILDTGRYPAIFFHAEHVRGMFPPVRGTTDIILAGAFNIHGADHPMELRLHLERQGDAMTLTTRFAVPYEAWGMKNPGSTFQRYSRQVWVDVTSHASVEPMQTAPRERWE
jgi:polyisoprenoid-binding protein YceI